jgi:hypothetical protein
MNAVALAAEATRYLETVDVFRSLELGVIWRSEADELGAPTSPPELQRRCVRCGGPLIRINGQSVCLRTTQE